MSAAARCSLIVEKSSGPGKGTPCLSPAIETLHGIRVCKAHSDEVRRANGLPMLRLEFVEVKP